MVFNHALNMWFPNLGVDPSLPGNTAHAAVVVFFVGSRLIWGDGVILGHGLYPALLRQVRQ